MSAALQRGRDGRLRLTGELDFSSVASLQPRLKELLQQGDQIDLDLSGVSRTNSAGLALLLQWQQDAAAAGASLNIRHAPQALFDLAQLSNLHRVLPFSAD